MTNRPPPMAGHPPTGGKLPSGLDQTVGDAAPLFRKSGHRPLKSTLRAISDHLRRLGIGFWVNSTLSLSLITSNWVLGQYNSPISSFAGFSLPRSFSLSGGRITMTGRQILHNLKVKAGFGASSSETGKGKCKMSGKHIKHGYHLVKGKSSHPMEDYVVAEFRHVDDSELGLFAIFDGHLGPGVADYLKSNLFDNILKEPDFWTDTKNAIGKAYIVTDNKILEKASDLGRGGSTAVTAILIDGVKLVVANLGDSRAVICKNGVAKQLSVDHEPSKERQLIEDKGGFVTNFPGDVPRVDGQLAVARAFGDHSLKAHLSSEPHVVEEDVEDDTECIILASDGLWKVMSNQEAFDSIKDIKDALAAAKHLTEEALSRKSKDDISCIVVKFQ